MQLPPGMSMGDMKVVGFVLVVTCPSPIPGNPDMTLTIDQPLTPILLDKALAIFGAIPFAATPDAASTGH